MSSIASSSSSRSDTETIVSVLSDTGGSSWKSSTNTKFVCHTSSIPLATIIDDSREYDSGYALKHNWEAEPSLRLCEATHCMYRAKDGKYNGERIAQNCPCNDIADTLDRNLQPICFLTLLKWTSHNLRPEIPVVDLAEVMICKNDASILDNRFPARLRQKTGLTGFENAKNWYQIESLLNCTYWYKTLGRKHETLYPTMEKLFKEHAFQKAKQILKQVLFTVNGCLMKKFLALGPEISSYKKINKQIIELTIDLLRDYMRVTEFSPEGEPIEPPKHGAFMDLKEFFKQIKAGFTVEKQEDRLNCLKFKFRKESTLRFFIEEINELRDMIKNLYTGEGQDYTTTLAWYYRMSTMAQGRVIGYLPRYISEVKALQYRQTITREPLEVPEEDLILIYQAVRKELRENKIPEFVLQDSVYQRDDEEVQKELFKFITEHIELPIKPSASVTTTMEEGGKIEDARILVNLARNQSWKIPIRNLNNFEIKDFLIPPQPEEPEVNYTRIIFWASLQIAINFMVREKMWNPKHYFPLQGSEELESTFLKCRILHIQEPGKDRNLTKSSAILTWLLTPAGKMAQSCLSRLPEHEVGLLGSSHGWKHGRRLSGLSDESSFMYNDQGKLNPEVVNYFGDWTESTDHITKRVGYTLFKAVGDFIGLPKSYLQFILRVIIQPQPVTEVVLFYHFEGRMENVRIPWSGEVKDGFMMGNPVTKTILHSTHIAEIQFTKETLKLFGLIPVKYFHTPVRPLINFKKSLPEYSIQSL